MLAPTLVVAQVVPIHQSHIGGVSLERHDRHSAPPLVPEVVFYVLELHVISPDRPSPT
jgi:hypothetical protein